MLITHTLPREPLTFFSSSGPQYEVLSERRSTSFAMVQLYRLLDGMDQRRRLRRVGSKDTKMEVAALKKPVRLVNRAWRALHIILS